MYVLMEKGDIIIIIIIIIISKIIIIIKGDMDLHQVNNIEINMKVLLFQYL